jgi:hypothetical protein
VRHSLHVAPLTDVRAPLHPPSNWSAIFHFITPLTDMRVPLHAPSKSNQSAVFCFVASLIDIHAPLHAPSDRSADLTSCRSSDRHAHPSACPIRSVCCISLRRSFDFDWRSRHLHVLAADLRLFFSHSHETLTLPLLCPNGSCTCTRHDTNPP